MKNKLIIIITLSLSLTVSAFAKEITIKSNATKLQKIAAIKKVYTGKIEIISISKKGAKVLTAQAEWVEITFKIK